MRNPNVEPERAASGLGGTFYGVYPAIVTRGVDAKRPGEIGVRLPMFGADDEFEDIPARLSAPMAGNQRGIFFVPEIGDEVLVSFEAGDPRRAYVLGALWNGRDAPPVAATPDNDLKQIRTRSGVRITFDDAQEQGRLTLETPEGKRISIDDAEERVSITDEHGNAITLDAGGISIDATAPLKMSAATLEVSVSSLKVESAMSTFSGVVRCDTLISNNVVASNYTPGAGNIW